METENLNLLSYHRDEVNGEYFKKLKTLIKCEGRRVLVKQNTLRPRVRRGSTLLLQRSKYYHTTSVKDCSSIVHNTKYKVPFS